MNREQHCVHHLSDNLRTLVVRVQLHPQDACPLAASKYQPTGCLARRRTPSIGRCWYLAALRSSSANILREHASVGIGNVEKDRLFALILHYPHHLFHVGNNVLAVCLRIGPRPQVVGTHPDDEIMGVGEEFQVIPHLMRPVIADLARNAPVGDPHSLWSAEVVKEVGISATGPGVGGAEVVPARQ